VISMEHYWPSADFYKPPRFHCAAWGYKVARSASAYPKPVFMLNALEDEGGAAPFKTTTEFTLAEGLANGGYRVFSPGANIPRYDGKQPLDYPAIRELHERYSAFIHRNRGLFWGIKPAHRAAVVYSVPTHMFHRFPAIPGLEDLSEYKRFAAACLLMETLNIPYDVLVLPHPELMPDLRWEEKLEDCDLVVFPGVAVMSRNQARLLASYVEKGGRILAFGPFARYDENYNPIPDLFAAQDFSRLVVVDSWDLDLGNDLWDRKANPEIVTKVSRILETLYPPRERQVSGRIPRETVVNVWEDREKHFYAFHLLNYDWNPEEDRVNPVENLSFSVDVPENYRSYSPLMLSPDLDSPRRLGAMALDGRAQIEIPPLNVYAVVVWGDPDFIKAKTDYAEAMNLGIRMTKLGEEMPERWWETLRELWREGKHGEIRDMAQEWEEKAKAVESIFLQGKENK
jgi:hypothetical protein